MARLVKSLSFAFMAMIAFAGGVAHAALPVGYTQVEYVKLDGSQHIATDIYPTAQTEFIVDFQSEYDGLKWLFGTRNYESGSTTGINKYSIQTFVNGGSNPGTIWMQFDNTTKLEYPSVSVAANASDRLARHTVGIKNQQIYFDGAAVSWGVYGAPDWSAFTAVNPLLVGNNYVAAGGTSGAGFIGKIYGATNMVPCKRNFDGAVGLCNTATGAFYPGNTPLVAGPIVCNNGQSGTYTTAAGTYSRTGTPSPTKPIYPTFYTQGDMVLRKLGEYTDEYNATTGKIIRRVGVKVFNGTERFSFSGEVGATNARFAVNVDSPVTGFTDSVSSHFNRIIQSNSTAQNDADRPLIRWPTNATTAAYVYMSDKNMTLDEFKTWVAAQAAAGTPLTIYYPLATPVEEDVGTTYCLENIRIATTKYVADAFAPVKAELDSTVNTIRGIVRDNKTQAQMVNQIQAEKQTRPDGNCPLYRQCLLVTDENGNPNWYPILDPFYDLFRPVTAVNAPATGTTSHVGYTQLEYIQTTGTQYITLPTFPNTSNIDVMVDVQHTDGTNEQILFADYFSSNIQFLYTTSDGWRVWRSGVGSVNLGTLYDRHLFQIKTTSSGVEYYTDGVKKTGVRADYYTSADFAGKTFKLGARTTSSGGGDYFWKGKIYSFKAECNGDVCMNLVPARRDGDGAIGMLDTVSGAFLINTGTGTFGVGPDVQNVAAEWTATFAADATNNIIAGTLSGTATCNATTGTANTIATSTQLSNANWSATGANCWCRAIRADYTNGESSIVSAQRWVYLPMADGHSCATDCAADCATAVGTGSNSAFRSAMSGI